MPSKEAAQSTEGDGPVPGVQVPGYRIVREIGRGGMGRVYEAVQLSTRRTVALKFILEGPFSSEKTRQRFEREVEILGQLNHPYIVAVHDCGTVGGHFYFVMDYIGGQPLGAWMADGERPIDQTLRLFSKICEAVNAAHLRGVIHRDLKPANIRIDAAGEPHILDFGLAKLTPDQITEGTKPAMMTMTGQFMGSLPWASPEQAEAVPSKIDTRTDVYSLGVILYQMLTGKFPYEVIGNMRDVLDRIIKAEPARPSTIRKQINDEVETIVLKCLQKEPDRRYQTAGELARDIQHYLKGEPIEAKRDSFAYMLRKQLRRYRVPVTIAAVFVLVVLAGFVTSLTFWRLATHRAEQLRQTNYLNGVAAAQAAWVFNETARMKQLLQACPPDLRGWEWYHLLHLSDLSKRTYRGHEGWVQCVAFSPDGRRIVSGSWDGTLRVWEADTPKEVHAIRAGQGHVICVAFSLDGRLIASAGDDGAVEIWDAHTGKPISPPLGGFGNVVGAVAFSSDGRLIASAGDDGAVKIWDAHTGKEIPPPLREHGAHPQRVAFSPDNRLVVSGGSDGTLKVWDLNTRQEVLPRLPGHDKRIRAIAFSPDKIKRLLVSGSDDGQLKLWDLDAGRQIPPLLSGHKGAVRGVAFSPDGTRIVSCGEDRLLRVWDVISGAEVATFRGHDHVVTSVAFSPDGSEIVTGSDDRTLKIWDPNTPTEPLTLRGHEGAVRAVAFSPDGTRIVSASDDRKLRVWNAATGQEVLLPLRGHDEPVSAVAFSPDGKRIVSASQDGTVRIWDANKGREVLLPLRGHEGMVNGVAFSPDGSRIVSGGADKVLRIWDANTGSEIGPPLRGHQGHV
ncbi:MAG TPA: protein kinase, partial [Phycisphaerae bacterium]|nr:protein kinase [Phycisphaerae bacterium]